MTIFRVQLFIVFLVLGHHLMGDERVNDAGGPVLIVPSPCGICEKWISRFECLDSFTFDKLLSKISLGHL